MASKMLRIYRARPPAAYAELRLAAQAAEHTSALLKLHAAILPTLSSNLGLLSIITLLQKWDCWVGIGCSSIKAVQGCCSVNALVSLRLKLLSVYEVTL